MGRKKKKLVGEEEDEDDDAPHVVIECDVPKPEENKKPKAKPKGQLQIKDARLLPRIREFIETRINKKTVNIYSITDHLMARYPEYSRKIRTVFLRYIEKAFAILIKGEPYLLEGNSTGGEDSAEDSAQSDDDVVLVEYKDTNAVNTMMSNLYKGDQKETAEPSTPTSEEKKRKIQPSDSIKKRQKTEASKTVSNQDSINNASVMDTEEADATETAYFLDRKGNKYTEMMDEYGEIIKKKAKNPAKTPKKTGNPTPKKGKAAGKKTAVAGKGRNADDGDNGNGVVILDESSRESFELSDGGEAVEPGPDDSNVVFVHPPTDKQGIRYLSKSGEDVVVKEREPGKKVTMVYNRRNKGKKTPPNPQAKGKRGRKSAQHEETDKDKLKKDKAPGVQKSSFTFADVGGNEQNLQEICKLLVHMRHPEVYLRLGVTPPRGFLLHGPPGCGKTLLANAIAGELDLPLIKLAATEIVSGVSGDSEEKIRDLFEKAVQCSPCVLFIDEIDAITPKRETASKDMERRIVAQLLACMDDLNFDLDAQVLVIGATNRPDSIDPALRRAGRFDREICLGIPDEQSRFRILQVLCRGLRLSLDFDFKYLAHHTPGYVGADLMALTREAAMSAVNRVFQKLQSEMTPMDVECIDLLDSDTEQQKEKELTDTAAPKSSIPSTQVTDSVVNAEKMDTIDSTELNGASVENSEEVAKAVNSITEKLVGSVTEKPVSSVTEKNQEEEEEVDLGTEQGETDLECSDTDIVPLVISNVRTVDEQEETPEVKAVTNELETETNKEKDKTSVVDGVDGNTEAETKISAEASDSAPVPVEIVSDSSLPEQSVGKPSQIVGATLKKKRNKQPDFTSVLSWLEQPPLTDAQLNKLYITMDDFKEALRFVQPSAKREGFATVPDVTWDDIGALHHVREELQMAILAPVRHAEEFRGLGLNRAQGVLLAGPPGCGKTLLAKAVANESGINFISVKGPELLNMYVGESEKAVRTVFQRARNSSPCVIFFDELDALCPRRSGNADSSGSTRVVNQLLTEMDGLEERKQVFIMAATNRPDIIDPAVLRPGRLDKTLYVGLPTKDDRLDIFKCITKNGTMPSLGKDVDLVQLAEDRRCEGYTGADLAALIREASVLALKEAISDKGRQPGTTIIVRGKHFEAAFQKIKPSVSTKDQDKYKSMRDKMTAIS